MHESVQLTCEVDANPLPVSFNWRFQANADLTSFLQTNESTSVHSPHLTLLSIPRSPSFLSSSVLTYAPHAPQEFGSIECVAKNAVGLQQSACKYHVVPSGQDACDSRVAVR